MSGSLGLRGFPGGGRQRAHPANRPFPELRKYVQEIFSEIDAQAPASFDDGSDGGDLRSCFVLLRQACVVRKCGVLAGGRMASWAGRTPGAEVRGSAPTIWLRPTVALQGR